jgi:hypothetical protein
MTKIVLAVAFVLALSSLPSCASAQAVSVSDSVQVRNRCRLAVQTVTTGNPRPHEEWSYEYIRRCGREGTAATAKAMLAAAANSDRTVWERLTTPAFYVRDGQLFEAALRIAQTTDASTTARVYSMRVLIQILSPGTTLTYADLTGGAAAQRVCFGTGRGSHHEVREVSLLPSDFRERVLASMVPLARDEMAALAVRQAATCVTVHARN